jgi:hypothetical protein
MGSSSVLFIGDDWRDQFERYRHVDWVSSLSPHFVLTDVLAEARAAYPAATTVVYRLLDGRELDSTELFQEVERRTEVKYERIYKPLNGAEPFVDWAARRYGVARLGPGTVPDFAKGHRGGWIRIDQAGEAVELVQRDIPDSLGYYYLLGTWEAFLLRPGATGWNIDRDGNVTEATQGLVGSARLRDIDLPAMRQQRSDEFRARWDAVHQATRGEAWVPFAEIRKRYPPQGERWNAELEQQASREWFAQPALQRVAAARCVNDLTHEALDPMLLARDDYVHRQCDATSALHYFDVVRHWTHLECPGEAELLEGLDDNDLLTHVGVKC